MLDLEKLGKSLKETLAKETTTTIDKWFEDYDKNLNNNNNMSNTANPVGTIQSYYGVRRVRKNKRQSNDYFVGVEKGEIVFDENPMKGDNYAFETIAKTVANILAAKDKVNTYEVFPITIG